MTHPPPRSGPRVRWVCATAYDHVVHYTVSSSWLRGTFLACNGHKVFLDENWYETTQASASCVLCVVRLDLMLAGMTARQNAHNTFDAEF